MKRKVKGRDKGAILDLSRVSVTGKKIIENSSWKLFSELSCSWDFIIRLDPEIKLIYQEESD